MYAPSTARPKCGGAHGLMGTGGCSYDEATNVPFFVWLPGCNTGHIARSQQMVSSVDFFGLLASVATYNPSNPGNAAPWRADNPQLATWEDLFSMLINNTSNTNRKISSSNTSLNGLPFVFHTCNEFYAYKTNPMPYLSTEADHIVGLRTPNDKLVYYINWYNGNPAYVPYPTQAQAQPSNFTSTSVTEYYNYNGTPSSFTADPNEISNQFSASNGYISAMQTVMASLIKSELQAQFTQNITYGVNPSNSSGISLTPVLAAAQTAYNGYIAPPSGVTWPQGNSVQGEYDIVVGSFTFSLNANSVEGGPTLAFWGYTCNIMGSRTTATSRSSK